MIARLMASATALAFAIAVPALAAPTNPLDALTADEINRTVEILNAAKQVNADTRFPTKMKLMI